MKLSKNYFKNIFIKLNYIYLIIGLILVDILLKNYISKNFIYNERYKFIDNILNIRYIHNEGAAFNLFSGKTLFLIVITVIFVLLMLYILFKNTTDKNVALFIVLILSGGIGNLYDRINFSYVRDFLEFDFISFPIFNIADIYITVAVILIILSILFEKKDEKRNNN